LALMVVWGYPCESKSSPAHYSNTPVSKETGVFFIAKIKIKIKNNSKRTFVRLPYFRDIVS
ncbi:hypothetical protein, partial [uncultured Acinetobacter sp.]|uniref:hypothetical protein n=1 Tax=uncultured Acinetobacter sp. TaxID=165433 RepID=UPI002590A627